jgi:hypothetical protein
MSAHSKPPLEDHGVVPDSIPRFQTSGCFSSTQSAPFDPGVRGDVYRPPELVFVEWVAGGPLNQIVDPHESDWITRPIQVDQV